MIASGNPRLAEGCNLVFSFNLSAFAQGDKYSQLAVEISNAAGESLLDKKIAIIPFSYADGREGTKDGSIISERLTMKMINLQKYENTYLFSLLSAKGRSPLD